MLLLVRRGLRPARNGLLGRLGWTLGGGSRLWSPIRAAGPWNAAGLQDLLEPAKAVRGLLLGLLTKQPGEDDSERAQGRLVFQLHVDFGAAVAGRVDEADDARIADLGPLEGPPRDEPPGRSSTISASHSTDFPAGAFVFQWDRRWSITWTDSRWFMNLGRFEKSRHMS